MELRELMNKLAEHAEEHGWDLTEWDSKGRDVEGYEHCVIWLKQVDGEGEPLPEVPSGPGLANGVHQPPRSGVEIIADVGMTAEQAAATIRANVLGPNQPEATDA